MPDTTVDSVQNYKALLMGDVSGDWMPPTMMRPEAAIVPDTNTVGISVPNTKAAQGSLVTVPVSISNLRGRGITSYQFDVAYDPSILEPVQAPADLAGTLSEGFGMAANSPEPGLLKVAVYGVAPASVDGIYVNLRFKALGDAGSQTPVNINGFRINDGTTPVWPTGGVVTVTRSTTPILHGRLIDQFGGPVAGAQVVLTGAAGEDRFTSRVDGSFDFWNLVTGQTYGLAVISSERRFQPRNISITDMSTTIDVIADR
jgi:hypothetical protein